MTKQFSHKGLAESHDFIVGLTFGIEIGSAFGSAHGQGGEGVLENLLKPEELEDAEIHGGMEAKTALIGPNGIVELDPEPSVPGLCLCHQPRVP